MKPFDCSGSGTEVGFAYVSFPFNSLPFLKLRSYVLEYHALHSFVSREGGKHVLCNHYIINRSFFVRP